MYRILIVEDDFDISELLQSWLTEAGYQTAEAEDGLKALEVFESGQLGAARPDAAEARRLWRMRMDS